MEEVADIPRRSLVQGHLFLDEASALSLLERIPAVVSIAEEHTSLMATTTVTDNRLLPIQVTAVILPEQTQGTGRPVNLPAQSRPSHSSASTIVLQVLMEWNFNYLQPQWKSMELITTTMGQDQGMLVVQSRCIMAQHQKQLRVRGVRVLL